MFEDESQDPIVLPSSWREVRPRVESEVQTRKIVVKDTAVQSKKYKDNETQTEETSEDAKDFQLLESNMEDVKRFLQQVYPEVSKQLIANFKSHAFDGYSVNWDNEAEETTNPYTLKHSPVDDDMEVTSLSWNNRGSVIAVSYPYTVEMFGSQVHTVKNYGVHEHFGWCTHRSYLCTWNIDRNAIDVNNADQAFDLDNCLLCTAFHPDLPPIIAGGNFNGEVIIWDLSRDDDCITDTSASEENNHQEPVSKVVWVLDHEERRKRYKLISVSGDGKVLIWDFNPITKKLYLSSGFIILTENIPRSMRSSKIRTDSALGVTCFSLSDHDVDLFALGTESGSLFKCSFVSGSGKAMLNSIQQKSPVTLAFDGHIGPVYDVDCSPYHRNLLLSCGSDAIVRIYSLLQVKPLLSIEPGTGYLFAAKWSPSRPSVFFLGTDAGKLVCYDLKFDQNQPSKVLKVNDNQKPIYALEFNSKRPQFLATGDGNGVVQIWSLSESLTAATHGEEALLEEIASVALS